MFLEKLKYTSSNAVIRVVHSNSFNVQITFENQQKIIKLNKINNKYISILQIIMLKNKK